MIHPSWPLTIEAAVVNVTSSRRFAAMAGEARLSRLLAIGREASGQRDSALVASEPRWRGRPAPAAHAAIMFALILERLAAANSLCSGLLPRASELMTRG